MKIQRKTGIWQGKDFKRISMTFNTFDVFFPLFDVCSWSSFIYEQDYPLQLKL
jgi:hypothetical protein